MLIITVSLKNWIVKKYIVKFPDENIEHLNKTSLIWIRAYLTVTCTLKEFY